MNKRRVPEILWRLFHDRARTLGATILSLIPLKSSTNCPCKGRRCLGCGGEYGAISFLLRENDPDDYRKLLNHCFVVVSDQAPPLHGYDPHCRWTHLEKQSEDFGGKLLKFSPVIEFWRDTVHLYMRRCSDIVEVLTLPSWNLLLTRIGDVLMVYLLKNTSIFLRLPRNKYHQVAGFPISDICLKSQLHISATTYKPTLLHPESRKKRSVDEVYSSARKEMGIRIIVSMPWRCRKKCETEKLSAETTVSVEVNSACCEVLPSREGQCYSNRHTPLHGKCKRLFKWLRQRKLRQLKAQGTHSLSPCMSFNTKDESLGDVKSDVILNSRPPLEKPNSTGARELFKEIFGSLGVNVSTELLKSLIRKAHHCQHLRLLEKHCSAPSVDQDAKNIAATILKVHLVKAEKSMNDPTQFSISSIQIYNLFNANKSEASVPANDCPENGIAHSDFKSDSCNTTSESQSSFVEPTKCYCLKKQVVSFVWATCRNIVPIDLLGTPSNWRVLTNNIYKLVKLRKFEKFMFKQCMRKVKLSSYPLLSDENSILSKHKLLEHWIFWLFSSFIVPLVQANFYATEAEHKKQDILYYRKPTWENVISKAVTYLRDQGHKELTAESVRKIIRTRSFGFSKIRLLPKRRGVRMLANLKASQNLRVNHPSRPRGWRKVGARKKGKRHNYKSVNEVLKDFHLVLKHIVAKEPERLGSSVFGYNDVYKKLIPFLSNLKSRFSVKPGVFIVVSDVERAFDSVYQDKLLSVLDDLNLEDEYFFSQVVQVVCTKRSLKVPENWVLGSKENISGPANVISFLPTHSSHGILVKQQGKGRRVRKEQFQNDLKEHIKRNVLQLGIKFFLQSVGIPQGSVLSTQLCSLYYGHLENSVLFPFLEKACIPAPRFPSDEPLLDDSAARHDHLVACKPISLLLRLIDDLLFISTSKEQASKLFSRLQRGFRAYNCNMNEQKFGTNFQMNIIPGLGSDRLYVVEDGTSFLQWCGLLINCSTLEIQADYTRYLNSPLSSTLTVSWLNKPGRNFKARLCSYLKPKCHPIFYDSNINSAVVVRLNIYQSFLLCAMKFHCYLYDLSCLHRFSTKFYVDALQKSLRYMKRLIKRRMYSFKTGSDFRPVLEVEKEEIEWLGLTAYKQVLKRKPAWYKELLHVIEAKLKALDYLNLVPTRASVLKHATDIKRSSVLWKIKY
uniref:Telomerase reverse transcriptase n=1 Tax=Solanum lycopersicum TaxID=4081 RepID=A0A3Q7EJC6_SOLLC